MRIHPPPLSIVNFLNRYSTGDTRSRENTAILLSFPPTYTDTSAVQGWSNPIGKHQTITDQQNFEQYDIILSNQLKQFIHTPYCLLLLQISLNFEEKIFMVEL